MTRGQRSVSPWALLASSLNSWYGVATSVIALLDMIDMLWPRLLDALGISSAVRPSFNIIALLLILFSAYTLALRYSKQRPIRGALKRLSSLGNWSIFLFAFSTALYYVAAELIDSALVNPQLARFQQLLFFLLALILAIGAAFLAIAFIAFALRARLGPASSGTKDAA